MDTTFKIQEIEKSLIEFDIKEKLVESFNENMKLVKSFNENIKLEENLDILGTWEALINKDELLSTIELYTINKEEYILVSRNSLFERILIKSFHLTKSSIIDIIKIISKKMQKYTVYFYTIEDSKTYQELFDSRVELDGFTVGDDFFENLELRGISIDQDLIYRAIFHDSLNFKFLVG